MTQLETLIQTLCPNGVKRYKLKEIAELKRGVVISKDYINEHAGEYPVYSSQTENNGCLGYIDTYAYDGTYLTWTTDGANAGTVFYREGKFNITNVCGLVIVTNPQISVKYLYYILSITAPKYVNRGMGNPKLMSNVMGDVRIPVPSKDKQSKIVRILDYFSILCSDISSGLPAEIEARTNQYEYYRDKLLSFKRKETAYYLRR
jgi:type I restriction enzyme S subunit